MELLLATLMPILTVWFIGALFAAGVYTLLGGGVKYKRDIEDCIYLSCFWPFTSVIMVVTAFKTVAIFIYNKIKNNC